MFPLTSQPDMWEVHPFGHPLTSIGFWVAVGFCLGVEVGLGLGGDVGIVLGVDLDCTGVVFAADIFKSAVGIL